MITLYFVLNGLMNGEDGVHACTTGVGQQQKDGWYWLIEGMDDGKGPFESREQAKADAEANPEVIRRKEYDNLVCVLMGSGGFHVKESDWDQVGNPIAPNVLKKLHCYDAADLGIEYSLGRNLKFLPPESVFLVRRGGNGYYLCNTGRSNYIRSIRYVGFDLPGLYEKWAEPQGSIDHMPDDAMEEGTRYERAFGDHHSEG